MAAAHDVAGDLVAQLERLPRGLHARARQRLQQQAAEELHTALMADPERWTEQTLAAYYHALAGGRGLTGLSFVEDTRGSRSQHKTEVVRRIELAHAAAHDDELQRRVMLDIAEDPKRLFNDWVWMVDPRLDGLKLVPVVLWDAQCDAVDFIEEHRKAKRSCMIAKSRDFGVSVLAVGLGVDYWLTRPHSITGYGSYKVEYVHKVGNSKSLFEKANVLLRSLPWWMLPAGFDFEKHLNFMHLRNPANFAELMGEGGDELGRGGRCGVFFADEFPWVANQQKSHQSLSGTTDCTVYFGTSAGVNTYFFRMKSSGAFPVLVLPWYQDPRKVDRPEDVGNPAADSIWKREKLKELMHNQAVFAQEFEHDDSRAMSNIVIPPEWVRAAVGLSLEPGATTVGGVDIATTGGDESVLMVRRGGLVEPLTTWRNLELQELAVSVAQHATAKGVNYLYYDASGLGSGFQGPMAMQSPAFEFHGVNQQAPADKFVRYDDDLTKPARERFANKGTELWWSLRRRFHRTYLHVRGEAVYPPDELISIPNDDTLIQQLSARQYFITGQGKIQLEDKRKMSVSPDRADALVQGEETFLQRIGTVAGSGEQSSYDSGGRYEW